MNSTISNMSLLKSQTFGLGKTNLADKFWGIWRIFGRCISTHFGTFPFFLQKCKPLYQHPKLGFEFEFGLQELRI